MDAVEYVADDLPPVIQRALSRLVNPAYFTELSPNERFAFGQLVRRVDADKCTEVFWCKRSNFAKLLGISEATVYRMLQKLEQLELIVRDEQSRNQSGALSVASLRLTELAIRLLGLRGLNDPALFRHTNASNRLAPVKDPNQETKLQFSSKRQSTDSSSKLPTELSDLHTVRGLTTPQIFLLMKLAKAKSQRLSDLWLTVKNSVPDIRAKRLFAYLRSILSTGKDWAFIAKQQRSQVDEKTDKERLSQRLIHCYQNMAGRTFQWGDYVVEACPSGSGFITIGRGGEQRSQTSSAPPSSPVGQKFWLSLLEESAKAKSE